MNPLQVELCSGAIKGQRETKIKSFQLTFPSLNSLILLACCWLARKILGYLIQRNNVQYYYKAFYIGLNYVLYIEIGLIKLETSTVAFKCSTRYVTII